MRRASMMAAFLSLALAGAAQAQTQAQMNQRAGTAFSRADAAMNRQWTTTYAAMKARDAGDTSRGAFSYAATLLASQRAWLRFRDAQCAMEGAQFRGGSAEGMAHRECMIALSKARTEQFRALSWQR